MPHKCTRCKKIYMEGSPELLNGCDCGARVFLYVKPTEPKTDLKKLQDSVVEEDDLKWIEREFGDTLKGGTIHLDVENMIRLGEGKFELDIESLMSGKPLVIKAREGVYYIDVPYAMKKKRGGKK